MKSRRLSVISRIKKYIFPSKGSAIALMVVNAFAIPVSLITPHFFQILIDDVMKAGNFNKFSLVVIGFLSVYLIRLLLDSLNLFCSNRLLNHFSLSLRNDVWKAILGLSFTAYEKNDTGDLKMRLFDDVDSLGNFIKDQVVEVVYNGIVVVVTSIILFRINIVMSLVCLLMIPLVFLVNYLIGRGQKRVYEDMRKVSEDYYSFEYNSLQYWKELKVQCAEKTFIGRFHEYRKILAKLGVRNIRYWFYSEVFTDFKSNYLTNVIVYIVGAFFVIQGKLTVGVLMMYAQYFSMLFTSIDTVNQKNVALNTSMPYYKRVFEMLDRNINTKETATKTISFKKCIQANKVGYRYRPEQNKVLNQFDFRLKAGEYAAVVGKSGCGKTTLIKLLLGLCEPQQGHIMIDGIPLNECNKDFLYQQIGVVMQDNILFDMTIRENMLLAKQNATQKELEDACRKANILDFINQLPDQFETVIGERGIRLSGGQRQRLLIAQALLKQPKILIFDEATSALDRLSEDIVDRSVHDLVKCQENRQITVLVISHKPSAVLRADRTMILDDGHIADEGTYQELITRNHFFQKIAASAYTDTKARKDA